MVMITAFTESTRIETGMLKETPGIFPPDPGAENRHSSCGGDAFVVLG